MRIQTGAVYVRGPNKTSAWLRCRQEFSQNSCQIFSQKIWGRWPPSFRPQPVWSSTAASGAFFLTDSIPPSRLEALA